MRSGTSGRETLAIVRISTASMDFRPNRIYGAPAPRRHWPRAALLPSPHHCHEMPNKPAEAGTGAAAMTSRGRRLIRLFRAARPDRLELRLLFVIPLCVEFVQRS